MIEARAVLKVLVSLTDTLAPQNRAAAREFLRFVANGPGGQRRPAKDVQKFRRVLNHCISVYMLDAAARDPYAIQVWAREEPDETLLATDAPVIGPDESPVSEESIAAIEAQLRSLERQIEGQERLWGNTRNT